MEGFENKNRYLLFKNALTVGTLRDITVDDAVDFESVTSANSIIPAYWHILA